MSLPKPFLFVEHLITEATQVAIKLTANLLTMCHLTLSFDGWSSKNHDKIYTALVTTPQHHSFLFDYLILTSLATIADSLCEDLSKVHQQSTLLD